MPAAGYIMNENLDPTDDNFSPEEFDVELRKNNVSAHFSE